MKHLIHAIIVMILSMTMSCNIDKNVEETKAQPDLNDPTTGDQTTFPDETSGDDDSRHDREAGETKVSDRLTIYTFTGSDIASCNSLVKDRLGYSAALCTIGGACGGDGCGKPGDTCASKSPTKAGACVYSTDITDEKIQAHIPVSGETVEQCNQEVENIFGFLPKACTIAGSCNGADPELAGACFNEYDFPLDNTDVESITSTYSITSQGDIDTCNALVVEVVGNLAKECTMGGACGTGCGVPGGDCVSDKPDVNGACIIITTPVN
jgi:hypothetical protein